MYSTSKYGFHHLSLEVLNMNQHILLEVQGKNRLYQLFDDSFNIHAISCTPEYGLWRSFIGGAGHESVYFSWRCRWKSWFRWLFEHFMHGGSLEKLMRSQLVSLSHTRKSLVKGKRFIREFWICKDLGVLKTANLPKPQISKPRMKRIPCRCFKIKVDLKS